MNNAQLLGSQTAKNGFRNEDDIVNKFNNWLLDEDARKWLLIMEYNLDDIEFVKAIKLTRCKTDVQVQVTVKLKEAIDVQNLQVKLVSNKRGFNQIDKRWVDKYSELWNIPAEIVVLLKQYTGETPPISPNTNDKRRTNANEFSEFEQNQILMWLNEFKSLIVSDILKGRGQFSAEWMLVAQKVNFNSRWILKPMNFCLNFFGNSAITITRKGVFKIGKITMQRKGGDGGRHTSNMLQFKIDPTELFEIEKIE